MELIDLNDLTQIVNFPTRIPDFWLSQSCSFGFICFFWHWSLFYNGFHSMGKFWSRCYLSSIYFPINLKQDAPFHHMPILMLIGMVSVIIWEMFHGRISLNAMLLLLLVNFLSEFRLELMYISLIISIKSNLTHLHGFACAAVIVHRNHFFWLYQQNKSSEFKVQTG